MVYFHLSHAKDTYSFFLFNECTVAESWIHMCEKLEKYEEIDLQNFLGSQMTLKGRREKKATFICESAANKVHCNTCILLLVL